MEQLIRKSVRVDHVYLLNTVFQVYEKYQLIWSR